MKGDEYRVLAHAEGRVVMEAENHTPDEVRGGCSCGFSVWSLEHVAVMSFRAAVVRL